MSSTIKISINTGEELRDNDCVIKLIIPSQCSDISIKYGDEESSQTLIKSTLGQNKTIDVSEEKITQAKQNCLDRNTIKELILKHIKDNNNGSSLPEIRRIFPRYTKDQIQHLLRELKYSAY